jgi:hypothetical protein
MIIIKKAISPLHVHGRVKIQVFNPEDTARMEPTYTDEGDNAVDSELLTDIRDFLKSSSGSSAYHLTYNMTSAVSSAQSGKNGMAVDTGVNIDQVNVADPGESATYEYNTYLMLYTKESGDSHSAVPSSPGNRIDFIGQAIYPSGASNASSVTGFEVGAGWVAVLGYQNAGTNEGFDSPFADYTATAFALSPGDLVRAEWSITIG